MPSRIWAHQVPGLKEELIEMFPERCRNGDGSEDQRGRVCSLLGAYVESLMARASETDARTWAAEGAGYFEEDCPTGPFYSEDTGTLVCGTETATGFNEF